MKTPEERVLEVFEKYGYHHEDWKCGEALAHAIREAEEAARAEERERCAAIADMKAEEVEPSLGRGQDEYEAGCHWASLNIAELIRKGSN